MSTFIALEFQETLCQVYLYLKKPFRIQEFYRHLRRHRFGWHRQQHVHLRVSFCDRHNSVCNVSSVLPIARAHLDATVFGSIERIEFPKQSFHRVLKGFARFSRESTLKPINLFSLWIPRVVPYPSVPCF